MTPPSGGITTPDHHDLDGRPVLSQMVLHNIATPDERPGESIWDPIRRTGSWTPDSVLVSTAWVFIHVVTLCPKYEDHRSIIRKQFPRLGNPRFSLATLFRPDSPPTLLKWIKRGGAFTKKSIPWDDKPPRLDFPLLATLGGSFGTRTIVPSLALNV